MQPQVPASRIVPGHITGKGDGVAGGAEIVIYIDNKLIVYSLYESLAFLTNNRRRRIHITHVQGLSNQK